MFTFTFDVTHVIARFVSRRTWKPVFGLWVSPVDWRFDLFGLVLEGRRD